METAITWTHLQWIIGVGTPALVAVLGWIGSELARLRQTRETDRKAEAAQRIKDQAAHDNDLRDLWQAFDLHRRDSAQASKEAAHFRERTAEQLGDIKASLAALNARLPPMVTLHPHIGDD